MMQPAARGFSGRWSWLMLVAACLGVGGLSFLSLAGRYRQFWMLSRYPRMAFWAIGGLLCALLLGVMLRAAWVWWRGQARRARLAWGLAFATAAVGFAALGLFTQLLPPADMPLLYTLDIETSAGSGPVKLLELRGASDNRIPVVDLQVVGGWQRVQDGLEAQQDQPGRLHYSFYAPAQGKLELVFATQPGGGQAQIVLDGKRQPVDLNGAAGQRSVAFHFQKNSRWTLVMRLADLALFGLVLPLVVLVIPLYGARMIQGIQPLGRGAAGLRSLNYSVIFVVLFLGLLLLPLQGFPGSDKGFDQSFWGYKPLVDLVSAVRHQVLQDQVYTNLLIGKDDWLVLTDEHSLDNYQNALSFSQEELFQIQQRLDDTRAALQAKGITFLVVVTPDKNSIYPEYVPGQIQKVSQQARLDQLLGYQRQHGQTQILDLRPALLKAKEAHQVFYRTDTHWNSYGAYAGYVEVLNALQPALQSRFPALKPHALDDYRYAGGDLQLGDMGNIWVKTAEKEPFFSLEPRFESSIGRFELEQGKVLYSFQYNQLAPAGLPSAIVYHDSYMPWMEPFLSDHFSKATYIWSHQLDENYIANEKPDIVIFEVVERDLEAMFKLPLHH